MTDPVLTCRSCRSCWQQADGGLWCDLGQRLCPPRRCPAFDYEPGTDEAEARPARQAQPPRRSAP